jgi:hypothetical protein
MCHCTIITPTWLQKSTIETLMKSTMFSQTFTFWHQKISSIHVKQVNIQTGIVILSALLSVGNYTRAVSLSSNKTAKVPIG